MLRRHSLARSLGSLAMLVGSIWLIVAGSRERALGHRRVVRTVLQLRVCGSTLDLAKRPAALLWGGAVAIALGMMWNPLLPVPPRSAGRAGGGVSGRPANGGDAGGQKATPLPGTAALPLNGEPADSEQRDGPSAQARECLAARSRTAGHQATLLDGKIPTQAGGTAKIGFGPSPFGGARCIPVPSW